MAGAEVSDMFAVGIVRLVGGPVPDHPEPRGEWRTRRREPAKQPELQVIAKVTGVTILHTPTMSYLTGDSAGGSKLMRPAWPPNVPGCGRRAGH